MRGIIMGDVSAEPSMEDILSSIKRIIAEEGEAATANRTRRAAKPAAAPGPAASASPVHDRSPLDEVLELRDAMPPEPKAEAKPETTVATAPIAEPILSPRAAEASRGALDSLSRLIVRAEEPVAVPADNTLEGLVRELIRPMLREWLDAKLPGMVEAMVAREIARITGQGR